MHAILVSSDNLPKIVSPELPDLYAKNCTVVLRLSTQWYLVQGYVDSAGKYFEWTLLPAYIIEKHFEYDPTKIQTDWDQIVRK